MRSIRLLLVPLFVLCIVSVACGDKRRPSRNRNGNRNGGSSQARQIVEQSLRRAKAQLAAAKQMLSGAQAAGGRSQGALAIADQQAQTYAQSLKLAKENAHSAEENVRQIRESILSQSGDPELIQSREQLDEAMAEFDSARNRILDSRSYRERYEEALTSPDRVKMLPGLREEALNDPKVASARLRYEALKLLYGRARQSVLGADDGYAAAGTAAREANGEVAKNKNALSAAASRRAARRAEFRKAQSAAAGAQAAIAQANAQIKSLEQRKKQLGRSGSRRSGRRR